MAANDTAALVVALSAQVSKFEKDMKSATDIADRSVKQIENRFSAMNGVLSSKFNDLTSTASSKLGTVGSLLGALGPYGTAAAVGLGTLVGVMYSLAAATGEFAEKSQKLKEAAETAGLTTTQYKLLGQAGSKVGMDFEQTTSFLQKFVVNLNELRDGSGTLYSELLKIDAGLARQIATTKSTAEALDILIKAYDRLDDATSKAALSKAAGGKGGLPAGRLLGSLADQGGLAGLVEKGPIIDEGQIDRAARLGKEIEAIRKKTANIWGSMFSDEILAQEREMAADMLKIVQLVERLSGAKERAARVSNPLGAEADDLTAEKAKLEAQLKAIEAAQASNEEHRKALVEAKLTTAQINAEIPALKGLETSYEEVAKRLKEIDGLLEGIRTKNSGALPSITLPPNVNARVQREGAAPLAPAAVEPKGEPGLKFQLTEMDRNISLLGEAATQAELLAQKRLQLKIATEEEGVATGVANRALAAFNVTMQASALATRERLGVATEQQIVSTKLAQLEQDRVKFMLTANEVQMANVIILREAKDAADALAVRQSYLPGLTKLVQDSQNIRKVLDDLAVSGVNSLTDALVSVANKSATTAEAFKKMAESILNDISRILIRAAISNVISNIFTPGVPAGTIASGAGIVSANPPRFAEGGFLGAGKWGIAGEQGPELIKGPAQIVPSDVTSSMMGGGQSFTFAPMIDARGADVAAVAKLAQIVAKQSAEFESRVKMVVRERNGKRW